MADVAAVKSAAPGRRDQASRVCPVRNAEDAGQEALDSRTNHSAYPLCLSAAGMFQMERSSCAPSRASETGWRRAMSQQERGPAPDGPLVSPVGRTRCRRGPRGCRLGLGADGRRDRPGRTDADAGVGADDDRFGNRPVSAPRRNATWKAGCIPRACGCSAPFRCTWRRSGWARSSTPSGCC